MIRTSLACAPIGCALFIVLFIVATSKDPEYVIFESYLSDLGVGPGAWAFNSAVISAGCLLVAFAVGGFASYFGANNLMKTGDALLALSGVFLAGVGVFTEDAGDAHLVVSYAFFVTAFLSFGVFATARFIVRRSLADPVLLVNAVSFTTGVVVVAMCGPEPFAETIAVFSLLAWGAVVSALLFIEGRRPANLATT